MWCTNDVPVIFVNDVLGIGGGSREKGRLEIEEMNPARKGWHENAPNITKVSIMPSLGKRRSLELYHTSRRFEGLHQGLEQ